MKVDDLMIILGMIDRDLQIMKKDGNGQWEKVTCVNIGITDEFGVIIEIA
mgnify:CR=1 FL=1